ncbi:MAG: hypothetical protein KJ964_06190, partial [Verrucomicrobia bacterium]|nr:hypothetical protein [Verrucomicrobiota bacterium]
WGCGGESGGAAFHEAEHTFGYAHASCALLRRFGAAPKVNVFMKHYTSFNGHVSVPPEKRNFTNIGI